MNVEDVDCILDNGHADRFIDELARFRETGHSINMIDTAGHTWLTRAIISGHIESYPGCTEIRVQAVLAAGADPNIAGRETLPLIYACGWQYGYGAGPNARIVKMLLDAGVDSNPHLSIKLPKTVIQDGQIDFIEDEFIEIQSVAEWLTDIETQNDLIRKYHPEFFDQVRRTEKELNAIRSLLEK